jgi:hypothetical protein
MDPELKHLVQETLALAKENHRLLRAVRRHQILDTFGKWIVWVVVFIVTGYSYVVYLQPIIDKFDIPGLSTMQSAASGSSTTTPLGKLINYFKAGK